MLLAALALGLLGVAAAQQPGSAGGDVELPPPLALAQCTAAGGCSLERANVTLDANWRWVHALGCNGPCGCFNGGAWDAGLCKDPKTCAQQCAIAGVNSEGYRGKYGVTPMPGGLSLRLLTGDNVGSRLYVTQGEQYKLFRLKNRELAFDVDVSNLPCGVNGALYLVEMRADGGLGGDNRAGAMYGTGYCDAQCPHSVKFLNGEANLLDWNAQTASGRKGSCCSEMDIWEANSAATVLTPHPCTSMGPLVCEGESCGDSETGQRYKGVCDKDGCDFNPFRMGHRKFYGASRDFDVDATKPITVVTQWLTSDGTDGGDLVEIRRLYVQGGRVIGNSVAGVKIGGDSITDGLCKEQKKLFGDPDYFATTGGLRRMGEALDRGMVLALSVWDDAATGMVWLDSSTGKNESGAASGPCPRDSGRPWDLRAKHPDASVKFWNIMYGEIGSTYTARSSVKPDAAAKAEGSAYGAAINAYNSNSPVHFALQGPTPAPAPRPPSPPPALSAWPPAVSPDQACAAAHEQCGGNATWIGPTCCELGCSCEGNTSYRECKVPEGGDRCSFDWSTAVVMKQQLGQGFLQERDHLGLQHWGPMSVALLLAGGSVAAVALSLTRCWVQRWPHRPAANRRGLLPPYLQLLAPTASVPATALMPAAASTPRGADTA